VNIISSNFADELTEKEMRDAYVEAQTRVRIAHQIRSLRTQREWSQGDLGKRLGKQQSNVSRLEHVEIGKYTLSTLFELASVYDVALIVDFASYPDFLQRTADLSPNNLQRPSFDRQALEPLCNDHLPVVSGFGQQPITLSELLSPLTFNVNPALQYTPPSEIAQWNPFAFRHGQLNQQGYPPPVGLIVENSETRELPSHASAFKSLISQSQLRCA
jgi:transcriptional regulator with XRE-family HTH domain